MSEVNTFIIKKVELKHQIRDLSHGNVVRFKKPQDLVSLESTEDINKNCWTCPRFDRAYNYCIDHLEFIENPKVSVCDEFDKKIEYYGERRNLSKCGWESVDHYCRYNIFSDPDAIVCSDKIKQICKYYKREGED